MGRKQSFRPLNRLPMIGVLGVALMANAPAQVNEYQVKAAFLYNFARFVEWPPNSFSRPTDPIVICILGGNPFGDVLDEDVRGKALGGRPFAVRVISEVPAKSSCQILFVNSSDRKNFRSMVSNLVGGGVLTVGDAPWFITDGGIINFKLAGGRIRFEISLEAAKQSHLSISSKLLSLAEIVRN